ncbi:MAG: CvpA family protein [Chitinophagaceae bacterium]
MIIDFLILILLSLALWRGYRQGLILGLFSLLAVIIGLAAAMKLSVVVSGWIGREVSVAEEWLPLISFVVVFIGVVILVRLGAKALEGTVQLAMLGWLNKLAGMLLYGAMAVMIFSVLLFYAEQMEWLKPDALRQSVTYEYIRPWGPKVINGLGRLVPLFRDMFAELEEFFNRLSTQIKS